MKRKRIDTLAFFTTQELIEEIINRTTFVGVVVASKDEHKRNDQQHLDFNTYASLSTKSQVVCLLKNVATNLEKEPPS